MTRLSGVARCDAPVSAWTPHAIAAGPRLAMIQSLAGPVARQVAVWFERAHSRAQLRTLDDRMLRDIGMSPEDVQIEVSKPFWIA